jgi:hypothetical protein
LPTLRTGWEVEDEIVRNVFGARLHHGQMRRARKCKTEKFSSRRTAVPDASAASTTVSTDVPARPHVFKPVLPRTIGASDNSADDDEDT